MPEGPFPHAPLPRWGPTEGLWRNGTGMFGFWLFDLDANPLRRIFLKKLLP